MIFILRLIIFSTLILLGFHISTHSLPGRRTVIEIYTFALLWYTMLCRLPIFTSIPTYGSETTSSVGTVMLSTAEKFVQLIVEIFGLQPDGTLAGGEVIWSIEGGGNSAIFSAASPPRPRGRICESALPTA